MYEIQLLFRIIITYYYLCKHRVKKKNGGQSSKVRKPIFTKMGIQLF